MAITLLCGAELQSTSEAFALGNSGSGISISTTVKRSGSASLHDTGGNGWAIFQIRNAGGGFKNFAQSCKVYFRVDALPSSPACNLTDSPEAAVAAGSLTRLNGDGTISVFDGAAGGEIASTNVITPGDGVWHQLWLDANGSTRTVYIDGVQWCQTTGRATAAPQPSISLGGQGLPSDVDIYFDDLVVDDSTIGAPPSNSVYNLALLIPTAGNNAGSWTDGAGGTGDIHGSVDNIPPVGVAAATAAAKIKNAASGTALDYVATMQTYLVGGVPAGSTVDAIQAICNDGEEVATGTKSGGVWCASNPAQSAVTVGAGVGFDYGNDGGALGTFPAGWTTHLGIAASAPSVTLSTAPTVTVRKGSSTTRVVDVDFMGLYVAYTPPPIGKLLQVNQAVKRASYY